MVSAGRRTNDSSWCNVVRSSKVADCLLAPTDALCTTCVGRRSIFETEGARGLFKGLGPTVFGVAPSRAIYFSAYSQSKRALNDYLPPNSPIVHICSAGVAGMLLYLC